MTITLLHLFMEIFKTIEFRSREFTVSNYGTVLNKKGMPRKLHLNSSGYMCYTADKLYLLHRMVASAFCDNSDPINKKWVNHKDGNKLNNNADNLEWVTRSENDLHKVRVLGHKPNINGLRPNWENPIQCKPVCAYDTDMNLVYEFKSGVSAARFFGVVNSAINNCLHGRSKKCKGYIIKFKKS